MIKSMGTVNSIGLMEDLTEVTGPMASSTVEEYIEEAMHKKGKENGLMDKK
jgi:hypothetical protein